MPIKYSKRIQIMKQSIWLVFSFTFLGLGQFSFIQSAIAQRNRSDTETVNIGPPVNGSDSGGNLNGQFDPTTQDFIVNPLLGGDGFSLSSDVFNSILSTGGTGGIRRGTGNDDGGSGVLGGNDETREGDSSSEVTICPSLPCDPKNDTGTAITLNDLAKLIEQDLKQKWNDLAAAEQLEQELKNQRIIKRNPPESNACESPALKARRDLDEALKNAQDFADYAEGSKSKYSAY